MKSVYISETNPGDELTNELYLLGDVVRRKTRDGRPFLLCTLRDRTGQMNGVFWDVPEHIDAAAQAGTAVLVTGHANYYKNSLQINITDLNPATNADSSELLPASGRPREEMRAELQSLIDSLGEPWQGLVTHILLDEDFLPRYMAAPAARVMHHAYVGGLLEHTLSMAAIAEFLAGHYPYVDRDLLLAGVLLHDVGKTTEYSLDDVFGFTEDGRLVGHIVRAIIMVEKAAGEIGFPADDLRRLVHLIASHHGSLEWGSPVTPKTLEAILLHQVDLVDSRVQGFYDHLRNDNGEGPWTSRSSPMHGSELLQPPDFDVL